ncbi:hypothetical protein [Limnohabitans sp. Jir72]|uniref:hypothetical protein n=1 Tax=Limnohabitans sp. Jir72 TaxID=1977909 RepID=UPI0011B24B30|nr:hypothetical protein [Limnohabitans sp. Jir72]
MKTAAIISIIVLGASLVGCGKSSSSSSYSGPSGLSSDQKDKYNNLSSEGKAYVDQQMKNYDNSRK